MKNVKYLGFVGLGCTLLLTGCGGSGNKLTCTTNKGGATQEVTLEFDSKGEKAIGSYMYLYAEIPENPSDVPEEISELQKEKVKDMFEQYVCSSSLVEDCKTTINGNDLEVRATLSKEGLDEMGSKEDAKKFYEDQGYTCK